MNRIKLFIITLTVIVISTSEVIAFDGDRKGFILGFGVGAGYLEIDQIIHRQGESIYTTNGLHTNFKIGTGITNKIILYYTGKQLQWFADEGGFLLLYPAIGCSYYLEEETPSFLFLIGLGIIVGSVDDDLINTELCPYLGLGYEFNKNINAEAGFTLARGPINEIVIPNNASELWTFTFSINYLGY